MPIPTLKTKPVRRIPEDHESPSQKGTMLPRATKSHTGAGVASTTHVTSQIPSPYQGHREGKQIRQGFGASKMGTRMSGNVSGPRPPPRTTSSLKSCQATKLSTLDRNVLNPNARSHTFSKPVASSRSIVIPVRGLQYASQQQSHQINVSSSNRSSVISNCSSNVAPSSSSSNRNSSSSIGSSFSIGSWNDNSDSQPKHLAEKHVNAGTFPRVKSIRSVNKEENLPHATLDRPKLKMPNTYGQKNLNSHLKNKIVGKPLSNSDSSITTKPRLVSGKPNASFPNLVESNSLQRFNTRIKNMSEKTTFGLPNPVMDSDSTDSEDCKNRVFKQGKLVRDVKYRKDNVSMITSFKKVQHCPVPTSTSEPASELSPQVDNISPEEDDGYGSVALVDQIEDERDEKKSTSYNETVEPSIEPLKPLKLMDSYSYFKCISNSSAKPAVYGKDMSSSACESAPENAGIYYKDNITSYPDDTQVFMSDQECTSNQVNVYKQSRKTGKESTSFGCATIPKNVKFSSNAECYAVTKPTSKIDDSIYGVSYGSLVNSKTEMIIKQTEQLPVRNTRKFGIAEGISSRSIENAKIFTNSKFPLQSSSLNSTQNIADTDYSPKPNLMQSPTLLEVTNDTQTDQQHIFMRTNSLRYPAQSEAKKELFPATNCDTDSEPNSTTLFKNASFPRGANKYSTVIPRTSDCIKARQNRQLTTFAPSCKESEPKVINSVRHDFGSCIETEKDAIIINLKMEIKLAKEQLSTLSEQLNSKDKLLSAYEYSLTNMTHRMHQLSSVVEQKDVHIKELKKMVEKACLDGVCISSSYNPHKGSKIMLRGPSMESLASMTSNASVVSYYSNADSFFSMDGENREKKKKNWIRSSFSKAFKRKEKKKDSEYDSSSDLESYITHPSMYARSFSEPFKGYSSLPASPVPKRNNTVEQQDVQTDSEMSDSTNPFDEIQMLRLSLREKESVLTETRLEALSSAHQVDGLKESIQKLSVELSALKTVKKLNCAERKKSESANAVRVKFSSAIKLEEIVTKKVNVIIPRAFHSDDSDELKCNQFIRPSLNIGQVIVSSTTTWKELYDAVEKTFDLHMSKIDTENCLGVDVSSIKSLRIGDIVSTSSNETQEFLPYGYFVGDVDWVQLNLANHSDNSMDELSYDMLIPKQNLRKYVSVLQEYRRIILGGADGTGKRFLAGKLAEVVIRRLGIQPSSINIATFQVHHHTSQELYSYLCHINELCEARRSDLPLVIIIESLNSGEDLLELLSNSLKIPNDQCPYIICTLRETRPETYELLSSLSNFRWISLISGRESNDRLLQRICRRACLVSYPVEQEAKICMIFDWIPRCFKAINCVLDNASVDLAEPFALLPLPKCLDAAQTWFSDIWKEFILPKIVTAAERCSNLEEDLDCWKKLYSCLREDLPWSVFPTNCAENFPMAFKTIEASC